MKKILIIIMSVILTMSIVYSKNNTSFKVGLPYSTAQILLGNKNVSGKNFTPTLGLSYFGISITKKILKMVKLMKVTWQHGF